MIFCVGSINLDFITNVRSLPVKGETVIGDKLVISPGGKGANQALAASRAGSKVRFVAAVGNDQNREAALKSILEADIDISSVTSLNSNTGVAFITLDEFGENQIVVSPGANNGLSIENVRCGLTSIKSSDTLLIQQEIPFNALEQALIMANAVNATIILNTAPQNSDSQKLVKKSSIIVCNEVEFSNLYSDFLNEKQSHKDLSLLDKLRKISSSLEKTFVVTLGDKGLICRSLKNQFELPALKVSVVDTIGAGDTFCGFLSACLDQGKTLEESLIIANKAAALACTKIGAQCAIPYIGEIG